MLVFILIYNGDFDHIENIYSKIFKSISNLFVWQAEDPKNKRLRLNWIILSLCSILFRGTCSKKRERESTV